MNREEAITTLKNYIERITGGMFPGEREILVEAFDALRGPVPDPITGLYDCGCGGKPIKLDSGAVVCQSCFIGVNACDNEKVWNRAMGHEKE